MIIRSKAPLRLGLAGGGTDVAPYSDLFGGAILNSTISMYAFASIRPLEGDKIIFRSADTGRYIEMDSAEGLPIDNFLSLPIGVYNRVVKDFIHKPLSFELTTYVDAPPGSGLGTSSTLVVAILGAFVEWLKLPLGEYDIAHLAYLIERQDLAMAGGKQDQYAAAFGGVNFMEFYSDDKVIVNPLRIHQHYLDELSHNLILYYTSTSRLSAKIIEGQQKNVADRQTKAIEAMHSLKEQAQMMKEVLLRGEIDEIGRILDYGWKHKKEMADGITNPEIDKIYETAMRAGANGGKISGAGGGGFMVFYCPGTTRFAVADALKQFGGECKRYQFVKQGLRTWSF